MYNISIASNIITHRKGKGEQNLKEIIVNNNDANQRIDRFLKKYLQNASIGTIYKLLRKKRIKVNGKKANPEDMIIEGDSIQFYLSLDTLDSFIPKVDIVNAKMNIDIIYEDENIILINKPKGILSHSANSEYENNVVDSMISYLIKSGDYVPRLEKSFTPPICNRLDRNTSGIIIGAKNATSTKDINRAIKNRDVKKFYKCMVAGKVEEELLLEGYLLKDEITNKVQVYKNEVENSKEIQTLMKPIAKANNYTLLEIDLITGRTHQIRAHLAKIGHPIVGDMKYGDKKVNKYFEEKYKLKNQFLHAYKIYFDGLNDLSYLNGKEFEAEGPSVLQKIELEFF